MRSRAFASVSASKRREGQPLAFAFCPLPLSVPPAVPACFKLAILGPESWVWCAVRHLSAGIRDGKVCWWLVLGHEQTGRTRASDGRLAPKADAAARNFGCYEIVHGAARASGRVTTAIFVEGRATAHAVPEAVRA
jgi:hypothetical protein